MNVPLLVLAFSVAQYEGLVLRTSTASVGATATAKRRPTYRRTARQGMSDLDITQKFNSKQLQPATDFYDFERRGGSHHLHEGVRVYKKFDVKYYVKRLPDIDGYFEDSAVAGMKREISILERLDHTNVGKIFAYSVKNRIPREAFFEYPNRGSLTVALESRDHPIDRRQRHEFLYQIMQGVKYLHEKKMYHGHINPSNIGVSQQERESGLIDYSGPMKAFLKNFQGARTSVDGKTGEVKPSLHAAYVAPEVLDRRREYYKRDRADVWSLGVLGYRLLVSDKVFDHTKIDLSSCTQEEASMLRDMLNEVASKRMKVADLLDRYSSTVFSEFQ